MPAIRGNYRYVSRHGLKKWAQSEATEWRKRGYLARVIKVNKQYPYEVFVAKR